MIPTNDLSVEQFLALAAQNKVELIDMLAARMFQIGQELALTNAEYFRQKNTTRLENFGQLAADHARLEVLFDAIKHAISALQSTLRAEREISQ